MEFLLSKKLELTIYQPDQEVKTRQTFSNLRINATMNDVFSTREGVDSIERSRLRS